jgi:hypothetical protein
LEISVNDTNYLISSQHFPFRINILCWYYLCHSDLFPSQTELKVIGHHHTYVRLKLIGHFVRRLCKRYYQWVCIVITFLDQWLSSNGSRIHQVGFSKEYKATDGFMSVLRERAKLIYIFQFICDQIYQDYYMCWKKLTNQSTNLYTNM